MVPKIWRTRLFVFTLVLVCIHYITLLYKTFGYEASHPYNSNQISNVGEEHIVVPQSVRHFHLRKELESKARAIQTVEENFPDLIEDSTMDNISDLPSLNEQNKAQEEDNNPAATLSKSTGKLEEMGKLRAKVVNIAKTTSKTKSENITKKTMENIPTSTKSGPTKTPVVVAPVTKAPAVNAPGTKSPAVNVPAANVPGTKAPVLKTPVTKAPAANVPVVIAPATKAPVENTPVKKTPGASAPVLNVPVVNAPLVNAPVVNTPLVNAPVVKAPVVKVPVKSAPEYKPSEAKAAVDHAPETNTTLTKSPRRKHRKGRKDKDFPQKRMILAWTWLHSRKPLWGIKPHSFKKCKYNNCYLTADRSQLDRADLLLFRIRELKKDLNKPPHRPYVSALDYSDMPPYHKPGQLWMDINQESPLHTHSDEELIPLDDKFNISVNYLLDSDLSISYIPVVRKLASPTKSNINFAAGKTKMALWFVSHCDAPSGRDAYVEALKQQGISVDIFGKCSGLTDGCLHNNFTCYHEVRSKYRFYLALENSVCNEYITEKFWNTLNSPAYNIPIALGARLSEYEKFSPPNSYLHVRNFTGVTELAKYMKRVAADDELFNSYHKWRDTHEIIPRVSESLHCYMCKVANEKTSGNEAYAKLSSYWSRKKNCELEPEPFKR